jgi:putative SOS response-associated peptidase YedK
MCARATLKAPDRLTGLKPRFNIAPTTPMLTARVGSDGAVECSLCRWGLIPSWSGGPKNFKTLLINARAETLTAKPSFRDPFKRRRCLVLCDGFYEWAHPEDGRKLPYHVHQPGDVPFAFAGLWDEWEAPVDEPIQSCTIITTEANGLPQRGFTSKWVVTGTGQIGSFSRRFQGIRHLLGTFSAPK